MSTLQEIQNLVVQARGEIQKGNRNGVQTVLWPNIKSMLGQCTETELEWSYRETMGRLIYKYLNDLTLQGVPKPPAINLEQKRNDLKAGKVKADEMKPISPWIPW